MDHTITIKLTISAPDELAAHDLAQYAADEINGIKWSGGDAEITRAEASDKGKEMIPAILLADDSWGSLEGAIYFDYAKIPDADSMESEEIIEYVREHFGSSHDRPIKCQDPECRREDPHWPSPDCP